jgi:hypothetical protein
MKPYQIHKKQGVNYSFLSIEREIVEKNKYRNLQISNSIEKVHEASEPVVNRVKEFKDKFTDEVSPVLKNAFKDIKKIYIDKD